MNDPTLSPGAGEDKSDSGAQQDSEHQEAIQQENSPENDAQTEKKAAASETPGNKKQAAPEDQSSEPRIVVRYGLMNNIGEFRNKTGSGIHPNTKVVVRTSRGVELGTAVCGICENLCEEDGSGLSLSKDKIKTFLRNYENKNSYKKGGRVLRIANEQDLIDYRHLEHTAFEAGKFCRDKILELKLQMRLVKVEHLLGGEKIIFHFTAETRVDFRELVRQLAARFRTRIEMHQVGARDEARLVADFERCGRQCCCKSFLKELKPVSMKMAKIQKATLDPTKISGRCGRLMCCLRYEDEVYNELRTNLPRKNSWVRTEDYVGKVLDTQVLTQLVRLWRPDNTIEVVSVEDIVERNLPEPSQEEQKTSARELSVKEVKTVSKVVEERQTEEQPPETGDIHKDPSSQGDEEKSPRKKGRRRKRRRNKKRRGGDPKGGDKRNNPAAPSDKPGNGQK